MKPRGWAVTDVGRKREHNEDSFLCSDSLQLYAVADGMGGHLGGERASHMAAEILEREMTVRLANGPRVEMTGDTMAQALRESTASASGAIFEFARSEPNYAGMGTTLTGLCFHGGSVTLCHVGDSRAYLFRDGRARQLTEDHSWVQEQVRAGLVSADDVLVSRFRNIITRSVGFEPTVSPDVLTMLVETGDCFLLCSDGLCNYLSPEELSVVLGEHFYGEAGSALVTLANERGGDDNITCVIVYVANAIAAPGTVGA
ncbi:MAG TPA: PP2C family serine/threonine-protein phosphatase [Polyangia bacterium]|jgi:protein phosphatase|nr:PP2C family serine/threonine-protein phosphatase [Polyangia bacterium]